MADNAVGGGSVTTQRSEIGNGKSGLAPSQWKPYEENAYCSKADFVWCFHG